jgi:hypothetical protein
MFKAQAQAKDMSADINVMFQAVLKLSSKSRFTALERGRYSRCLMAHLIGYFDVSKILHFRDNAFPE